MNNNKSKKKFISNNKYNFDYNDPPNICSIIDDENFIKFSSIIDNNKIELELIDNLSPNNYNLNYNNTNQYIKRKGNSNQHNRDHKTNLLKKQNIYDKNKIITEKETLKKNKQFFTRPEPNYDYYLTNIDTGAGRGFGNLNVSNDIRLGDSSKLLAKQFRKYQEKQKLLRYQFQYLYKNVQDPNHIVMDIPRGGSSTRKEKLNLIKYV